MRNMRDPFDPQSDPIDVGAVNRDDAFIEDLAAGRAAEVTGVDDYEVASLITAWRSDALSAPIPAEPTLAQVDDAMAVRNARGSLSRRLRIVSGAAAILAVFGAGLMVMSEGAEPGDALWSVKQVVFADEAQQTQARVNVEGNLKAAEEAFAAGDQVMGRTYVERARADLGPVKKGDVHERLEDRIKNLIDEHVDAIKEKIDPRSEPSRESTSQRERPTSQRERPTLPWERPTLQLERPTLPWEKPTADSTSPETEPTDPRSSPTKKPTTPPSTNPSMTTVIPVPSVSIDLLPGGN
ncbi:anti-sigma-D factor RsdA [Gordonia zhaorongruii]|uniref:anti-sigma-D factor RsdA n=1 Tax=Gordonia zhaorongruii TaxID=2597659 RepID=UPI00104F95A0|nr:anti-sigma-D factor RsdA [Gordonia zhaorongruii]